MSKVAFIGLGNMGNPMAQNLVRKGYAVAGFDVIPAAVDLFEKAGGIPARSIDSAIEGADYVVTMLPSGKHVAALLDDDYNLFSKITSDTMVIDASTIDTATARRIAQVALDKGISFIDAPVSGGVGGAIKGTLTFIVGGTEAQLERARPVLESMGQNLFLAGPAGSGQIAKACNNMLLAITMIGTAEALSLGKHNGLDPAVLSEIMKKSSGGNWALNVYNPVPGVMENVPASNDYQGGFMVKLMNKDLQLAAENALAGKTNTPMGSLARSLYTLHGQNGHDDLDFSSVYKMFSANT